MRDESQAQQGTTLRKTLSKRGESQAQQGTTLRKTLSKRGESQAQQVMIFKDNSIRCFI